MGGIVLVALNGVPSRTRLNEVSFRTGRWCGVCVACFCWFLQEQEFHALLTEMSSRGYIAAWPTKGQMYFARLTKTAPCSRPEQSKHPARAECEPASWL